MSLPFEIERKFLVRSDFKPFAYKSDEIIQAYISTNPAHNVRIRRKGEKAYLTIKGESDEKGVSRIEWEKEISLNDFEILLSLCNPENSITKTRYYIKAGQFVFEVDEFHGRNEGLIVAEIELKKENDQFEKPDWLGKEVTGDKKYYNSQLSENPYSKW